MQAIKYNSEKLQIELTDRIVKKYTFLLEGRVVLILYTRLSYGRHFMGKVFSSLRNASLNYSV